MARVYLNKKSRFKCQAGNAVFFRPNNSDSKVKVCGDYVLLDDCSLSLVGTPRPGQCNFSINPATGTPPFTCNAASIPGMGWNSSTGLKVGARRALTSSCSISCPVFGQAIKPFPPTCKQNNVNVDSKANMCSITAVDDESKKEYGQDASPESLNNNSESAVLGTSSVDTTGDSVSNMQDGEVSSNEAQQEPIVNTEYAMCDYQNCDKASTCEYLKSSHEVKETNESKNATKLKENMGRDAFDLYAGECQDIETSAYSVAHHHIVPVNQCFKHFPELVKLANYYNYDINKAENGICLPTMNLGYDKQPFDLRREIAFEAMERLGKQWHKGGHKYSAVISPDFARALEKPFRYYSKAVDELLGNYRIELISSTKCRAKDYEQQVSEFTKSMDHICEKISKKLRSFEGNPKKSYPFFISKMAFYYAYYERLSPFEDEWFRKDA